VKPAQPKPVAKKTKEKDPVEILRQAEAKPSKSRKAQGDGEVRL